MYNLIRHEIKLAQKNWILLGWEDNMKVLKAIYESNKFKDVKYFTQLPEFVKWVVIGKCGRIWQFNHLPLWRVDGDFILNVDSLRSGRNLKHCINQLNTNL